MQKSEYEFQLFGFTALQHSLERRYLIQKKLNDALKALLEKVVQGVSSETVGSLVAQTNLISKNIICSLEKDFKSLDTLDQRYFNVPRHVLLESDFVFAKEFTNETELALDGEISRFNQLYLENGVFYTFLKEENTKFASVKPFIDDEIGTHAQLKRCLHLIFLDLSKNIDKTKVLIDKL